ncbi:MAG: hypothetical protein U9Q98_06560 [Bacteroidota bacterium]|nr:hypothetical protein [Bacteroidota bacterium]
MKYLLLIFTALALLFMSACEKEEEFPDHEAHIRFVNHTNMVFDSVVIHYRSYNVNGHGFFQQAYLDLHPGDTSDYQSDINIEESLTIKVNTPDTTYLSDWAYPAMGTDPMNPQNVCFFETGYYTFSLYNTDGQSNTLYAGLISYSMH